MRQIAEERAVPGMFLNNNNIQHVAYYDIVKRNVHVVSSITDAGYREVIRNE